MRISRRRMMQTAGVAALATPASHGAGMPEARYEGKDTPKLCLGLGDGGGLGGGRRGAAPAVPAPPPGGGPPLTPEAAAARKIRQIGVEWVLSGGPPIPWDEARLKEQMARLKDYGLNLGNLMIAGFNNAIYDRPGRDQDIEKVIASIQAAGKARPAGGRIQLVRASRHGRLLRGDRPRRRGLDGIRLRTGADGRPTIPDEARRKGMKFKDLPPLPNEGAHTLDEMWSQHHLLPEGGGAGGRKGGRAAGAASQRSARADQPRVAADHGDGGRLEAADRDRQEPMQRHHLRLRRDPGNGPGPGGGVPLLRLARPYQSRAFPQRQGEEAIRAVHRSLHRRGREQHVRRDAGAGQAQVHPA